ncbi:two-component system response regulator CreB [Piscinibacter sakaiensis]|uniref:Two-component response regulator CreB n=1 Tax=Piscinibacter sakaiensis TaxID=1547922 RepID=A0A0K8P2V0_PISS1|nr:two-component system response regulator CreB [Piscinibacter sakaiensis]GAP36500.1 two-component response regulator CreB [Piscinibacter sakaiensis]
MPPPRILLLEDEPAIADTLVYALRSEGYAVEHVRLVAEARAALAGPDGPALAILDIGLPDGSGFDVCRELRRRSELPVLFLTARHEEIDRVLGLELGADDYVVKPFSPREVAARVRAILRRTRAAEPASPASGTAGAGEPHAAPPTGTADRPGPARPGLTLDEAARRIACDGRLLELTRYEYRLLAALMRHPGRICTRAELMERVWHDAPDTADRTVDAHVKLLRAKLRGHGVPADWIRTHRHLGYAWQPGA